MYSHRYTQMLQSHAGRSHCMPTAPPRTRMEGAEVAAKREAVGMEAVAAMAVAE